MGFSLNHLTFVLLFSAWAGFFVSFGLVRAQCVGPRYFVYHGLGTLLLTAATFWLVPESLRTEGFQGAYLGFCLSLLGLSIFSRSSLALRSVLYLIGLVSLIAIFWLDARLAFENRDLAYPVAVFFSNSVLSALLLGLTLAAMILGHWYLIEPKLPIEELKRVTLAMIIVLGARLLFGAYTGYVLLSDFSEIEMYRFLAGTTPGIFLLMRLVWGIVGPIFLSILIWKTVQIRSTQSATGILYVACLFVIAGEIISQYLALQHGIPL